MEPKDGPVAVARSSAWSAGMPMGLRTGALPPAPPSPAIQAAQVSLDVIVDGERNTWRASCLRTSIEGMTVLVLHLPSGAGDVAMNFLAGDAVKAVLFRDQDPAHKRNTIDLTPLTEAQAQLALEGGYTENRY